MSVLSLNQVSSGKQVRQACTDSTTNPTIFFLVTDSSVLSVVDGNEVNDNSNIDSR
jgi:hypothetical protein